MVFTTTFAKTSLNIATSRFEVANIKSANKNLISRVINYLSELAGEIPDPESDVLYTELKNLYPHLLLDYVSISNGISGNTLYIFSFQIISYAGLSSESHLDLKDKIFNDLHKYFSSWNDQNENEGIFNITQVKYTDTFIVTYVI